MEAVGIPCRNKSHQSAQAGRTPKDYYTAARPVLPAVWGMAVLAHQRSTRSSTVFQYRSRRPH